MTISKFLTGGRTPAAKFPTLGASVGGPITEEPQERQQTDYETREPLTWSDGSPRMQWVITVQTDRCDDEDDDGRRRIFAKGQLLNEIRRAVKKAHAKDIEVGGVLTVTYVRDGERTDAGLDPPKVYEATYVPPDDSTDDDGPIGSAEFGDTDDAPF
jgi:hypothetical protein